MPLNVAYVSNNVPFGGFTATIYRPSDPLNPGTSPTQLGTYYVESADPSYETIEGQRPAPDGGDNGWWLVKGRITGNAVIQLNTEATPTLEPGDFFAVSTDINDQDIEVDSTGTLVTRRFVIKNPSKPIGMQEYRKQNCGFNVDKFAA